MNLGRNGATTSQRSVATRDDSHWLGLELALLLVGLFLLTVLLMTAAIILLADHTHISLVAQGLPIVNGTVS